MFQPSGKFGIGPYLLLLNSTNSFSILDEPLCNVTCNSRINVLGRQYSKALYTQQVGTNKNMNKQISVYIC